MKFHKVIRKRIDKYAEEVSAAGELNVVISAQVNEPGTARTESRSSSRIVQRSRVGQPQSTPKQEPKEEHHE